MLDDFMKKPEKQRCSVGIAISIVVFAIGYYILNYISSCLLHS